MSKTKDIPGQMMVWDFTDGKVIKCVAVALDKSVTEEQFCEALIFAANAVARKYRNFIPSIMSIEDFKQEVIVAVYERSIKWRDQKKQSFKTYVFSNVFNAARDILRKDSRQPPVQCYSEFLQEPTEEDRGKWRFTSDEGRLIQEDEEEDQ